MQSSNTSGFLGGIETSWSDIDRTKYNVQMCCKTVSVYKESYKSSYKRTLILYFYRYRSYNDNGTTTFPINPCKDCYWATVNANFVADIT